MKKAVRAQIFERLERMYPSEPFDVNAAIAETSWIVEGFIVEGRINCFAGAPKTRKSRILGYILIPAILGSKKRIWRRFKHKPPGRILYLLAEEEHGEVVQRWKKYASLHGLEKEFREFDWAANVTFLKAASLSLEKPDRQKWLTQVIKEGGYKTVIMDPLRRVYGGKENSNDDMGSFNNWLRNLTSQLQITTIIIHHSSKINPDLVNMGNMLNWFRGASDFPSVLDWACHFDAHHNGGKKLPGETRDVDRIMIRRDGRQNPDHRKILRLDDHSDEVGFTYMSSSD